MLNHLCGAAAARRTAARPLLDGATTAGRHWSSTRLEASRRVPARDGLPVWRYDVDGVAIEKRVLMPHRRTRCTSPIGCCRAASPVRLELRPLARTSARTRRRSARRVDGAVPAARASASATRSTPGGELPPLRLFVLGAGRRRSRSTAERLEPTSLYAIEESRGYESRGELWSPGYFRVDARPGRAGDARRLDRVVGDDRARSTPREALARRDASGAAGCSRCAHRRARDGRRPRSSCSRPTSSSSRPAGRVEDAARARAAGDEVRTVIAGYHWFTDWGRDTMISLEGLTLATGRAARGGVHPAHLRALRARRPDPEHVPRGRQARGCTTRPTRRCGSSTRVDRYLDATGDRAHAARSCCRSCIDIVDAPPRGTRFGIGVDPRDGLLRQGARGLPAHLDGREGGRLGRDAAARQGGRDQRALVQRAAAAARAGCARKATATRPTRSRRTPTRARDVVQPALLVRRRAATCTTWSTASRATTPRCRPNQLFAISLPHPVLDRERWAPVLRGRARAAADAGRACARSRRAIRDYKPQYYGDLRARDAAYHQGTVWAG